MNCPSEDQSLQNSASVETRICSSLPLPFESFWYMFTCPSRFEENAMRLPSGDQMGNTSFPLSNVNRVCPPPCARSVTQRSHLVEGSRCAITKRLSSRERRMYP